MLEYYIWNLHDQFLKSRRSCLRSSWPKRTCLNSFIMCALYLIWKDLILKHFFYILYYKIFCSFQACLLCSCHLTWWHVQLYVLLLWYFFIHFWFSESSQFLVPLSFKMVIIKINKKISLQNLGCQTSDLIPHLLFFFFFRFNGQKF